MANNIIDTLNKKNEKNSGATFKNMAEMFGLSGNLSVIMLPIDRLVENANHPFKVKDDEQLAALAESIKHGGLIQPIIVRKLDVNYEILSGHRRMRACDRIGEKMIKAIIVEVNDEIANQILIDTNFMQRDVILPSEIAKSYLLRYTDLKKSRKMEKSDGRTLEQKIGEILVEEFRMSKSNIYMYLRFNKLIDALLDMIDERKLKLKVAAELSYIRENEQATVYDLLLVQKAVSIDYKQAAELKHQSEKNELDADEIKRILTKPAVEKVTTNIINNCDLKKYIKKFNSIEVMKKAVFDFLEAYKGEE